MSSDAKTALRRGLLLVLTAPSGGGKTSVAQGLLARDPGLAASVSVTTRPPRGEEVEGRDYRFISPVQFQAMAAKGDLLEHATVHGHSYGTPRAPVEAALESGRDLLLVIDWQGARQLRERLPKDVLSVFIMPPSTQELERRLVTRGQDQPASIARRMRDVEEFVAHAPEYDRVVVNDDLGRAIAEVEAILQEARKNRGAVSAGS